MANEFHQAQILPLSGTPNGTNRTFAAPSNFRSGTFRLILNGQLYEPDDQNFGWTEVSDTSVELVTPPRTGDILQGYYQEKTPAESLGIADVRGTPFDPTGALP